MTATRLHEKYLICRGGCHSAAGEQKTLFCLVLFGLVCYPLLTGDRVCWQGAEQSWTGLLGICFWYVFAYTGAQKTMSTLVTQPITGSLR